MKKIINLSQYRKNQRQFQNYKNILKDLKEVDILFRRMLDATSKYLRYSPVVPVNKRLLEGHREIKNYITQYEEFIKNYDGRI